MSDFLPHNNNRQPPRVPQTRDPKGPALLRNDLGLAARHRIPNSQDSSFKDDLNISFNAKIDGDSLNSIELCPQRIRKDSCFYDWEDEDQSLLVNIKKAQNVDAFPHGNILNPEIGNVMEHIGVDAVGHDVASPQKRCQRCIFANTVISEHLEDPNNALIEESIVVKETVSENLNAAPASTRKRSGDAPTDAVGLRGLLQKEQTKKKKSDSKQDGSSMGDDSRRMESNNVHDDESSCSEFDAIRSKREKELSKPIYFNVMIVGESGIGKSTFIDAFLSKRFQRKETIRPATLDIKEYTAQRTEANIAFNLKMIDTPGYSQDRDMKDWYKMIKRYLKGKFDEYKNQQKELKALCRRADGSKTTKTQMRELTDPRVHVCLYFLAGPRIKTNDILYIKKLQRFTNIIPVLAKGDCHTVEEIKEIKRNLLREAQEHKLEWFDCVAALKNNKRKIRELQEGPFGPSPPFLIISSTELVEIKPNKFVYGRKYLWGTCNLENPAHSDFSLLYNLLIGYFSLECIALTQVIYEIHVEKEKSKRKEKSKKEQESNKGILLTSIISSLGFGALYLLKRSLADH